MKAIVKKTGEVVEVKLFINSIDSSCYAFLDENGKSYFYSELDFGDSENFKNIDWEQRRYEIAKAVMCSAEGSPKQMADYAVSCADELIKKLKKN